MHSINNNIESNFKILNLRPFEPFETETSLAQQNTHQQKQRKLPKFDIDLFFRITGPSLPYALSASAMAESPDGRGVMLFGGGTRLDCTGLDCYIEDRILELRAGATSWNILNITLQNKRFSHTVIPIQ